MSLLKRMWHALKGADGSISSSLDLFRQVYGFSPARSGESVTWKTALEVSTVLACVRVCAEGVAQVPFRLYRDNGNGGRDLATDHAVFGLISNRPNRWQTSFEFRETLMVHTMLTNNAFVFLNRVGRARELRELVPIEPGRVTVEQLDDLSLQYKITPARGGAPVVFGQDAIWHLRGPSWNSWMGLDATRLAREAIGLSMALERSQAEFQRNGAKASGLLSVDAVITPEKYEFLAKWIEKYEAGGERANKAMVLDNGAKYTPFSPSAIDQQLLESRKNQVEEICRALRVMPIMVGHADKAATYASAEQMFLAHVVHTLSPWYARIEQSANAALLDETDRANGLYTKFTPNALMRGAANDRANFYSKALGAGNVKGWMTQNEIRALEELERSDDEEADQLPQPTNQPSPQNNTPSEQPQDPQA